MAVIRRYFSESLLTRNNFIFFGEKKTTQNQLNTVERISSKIKKTNIIIIFLSRETTFHGRLP